MSPTNVRYSSQLHNKWDIMFVTFPVRTWVGVFVSWKVYNLALGAFFNYVDKILAAYLPGLASVKEFLYWYKGKSLENLHTVDISHATYLPRLVNIVCERHLILWFPIIGLSLNSSHEYQKSSTNIWLGKVRPYLQLKMCDLVGKTLNVPWQTQKRPLKEDSTRLKLPFPMTAFLAKVCI